MPSAFLLTYEDITRIMSAAAVHGLCNNALANRRDKQMRNTFLKVIDTSFLKEIRRMFCHCTTKCTTDVPTAGKTCEFLGGSEEAVAHPRGFEPLTSAFGGQANQ